MWSAATTIAELYTGKILFPGRTNNQMLSLQMQIKGKFPKKILRKAQLRELHFEEDFAFIDKVPDEAGNLSIKVRKIMGPTKDLYTALVPKPNMVSSQDLEKVHLLKDLMEKMLTLDPDKRPTPLQALNHPFLLKKTPA